MMAQLRAQEIKVALTGAAGSAYSETALVGELVGVHINYNAGNPAAATTVVKLSDGFGDIYTAAAGNTSKMAIPLENAVSPTDAALTAANRLARRPLADRVKVAVSAGATGGSTIVVTVFYR